MIYIENSDVCEIMCEYDWSPSIFVLNEMLDDMAYSCIDVSLDEFIDDVRCYWSCYSLKEAKERFAEFFKENYEGELDWNSKESILEAFDYYTQSHYDACRDELWVRDF